MTEKKKGKSSVETKDDRSYEEVFEEYRKAELFKAESAIAQDSRADTWIGIKARFDEMFKEGTELVSVEWVSEIVAEVRSVHEAVKERIAAWKAEDFGVVPEVFVDPYSDLLRRCDKYSQWTNVFEDYMVFSAVRPFGENAQRINSAMMQERWRLDEGKAEDAA